jgi:hypothetical protein
VLSTPPAFVLSQDQTLQKFFWFVCLAESNNCRYLSSTKGIVDILKSTEHINEQRKKNADELKIGIDFMARC